MERQEFDSVENLKPASLGFTEDQDARIMDSNSLV